MDNNEVVYQLVVEDVQNVAIELFGRELSDDEIKKLKEPIGNSIPWYDIITNSIKWELGLEEVEEGFGEDDDHEIEEQEKEI